MSFFPDDFTFGDNSTLTSFTDLRDNPKPGSYYVDVCSHSTTTGGRRVMETSDKRSEIDEEDKENSDRKIPSHSSSSSSNEFWATLSVHAASAVMSDGWTLDSDKHDDTLRQAAASAAATSLLEDGREMERINAARIKSRGVGRSYVSMKTSRYFKAPMRITHQTVRNAATKASIAVLRSGAPQEVAAAVAGAILKEGGKMLKGGKVKDGPSSDSTEKTNNTSGSCYNKTDGSSHSSHSHSSPRSNCSGGSKSSSNFACLNSTTSVSVPTKSPKNIATQNKDIHEEGVLGQGKKRDTWKEKDDTTIQSVPMSKFGLSDKYATDSDSMTIGERDIVEASRSFVGNILGSIKSTGSARDRANVEVEEDRGAASDILKVEGNRSVVGKCNEVKKNNSPTIEEALGDALGTALAMMEKNGDSQINDPVPPSLTASSSGFMPTGNSSAATAGLRQGTESVATAPSLKEGHSTFKPAEQQIGKENDAVRGETDGKAPIKQSHAVEVANTDLKSAKDLAPENENAHDDINIDAESYKDNNLQQIYSYSSGILSVSSLMAASVEEKNHQQSYELERGVQALRTAEQLRQLEEQEFERRQARFLIAMEVLRRKLDELEICDQAACGRDSNGICPRKIGQQGQRPTIDPPPHLSHEQLQTLQLVANEISTARYMLEGPTHTHCCQIEQLSMIATPSLNSSSIIKNPSPNTNPPMPPTDIADTNRHGHYGDITPASKIKASGSTGTSSIRSHPPPPSLDAYSAASSIHGRYSVPPNSVSLITATESSSSSSNNCDGNIKQVVSAPPSSSSVRSVLKKPSKCYPITEIGDEDFATMEEAEWDENGTVYTSVGECRIRTLNDTNNGSIEIDAGGDGLASGGGSGVDTIGCCPEIVRGTESSDSKSSVYANHKEKKGDSELSKEAIEVVLVLPTSPTSPSSRLRSRFKGFFRRNGPKKVTFDISNSGGKSSELSPFYQQQACPPMGEGLCDDNTCGEPAICRPSSSSSSLASAAPECINNTSGSHRGSRLRDSIFKRLRRGLPFKSGRRRGRRRGRGPMGPGRGHGLATAIEESVQEAGRNETCTSGGPMMCGEVMDEKGFADSIHTAEGIVPNSIEKAEHDMQMVPLNGHTAKNDDSSMMAGTGLADNTAAGISTDSQDGILNNAQTESSSCLLNVILNEKTSSKDETVVSAPAIRPIKHGAKITYPDTSLDDGSNSRSNAGSNSDLYSGSGACSDSSSRSIRLNKDSNIKNSNSESKLNTPLHETPEVSASCRSSSQSIGTLTTETWVDTMLGKLVRRDFILSTDDDEETLVSSADRSLARYNFI